MSVVPVRADAMQVVPVHVDGQHAGLHQPVHPVPPQRMPDLPPFQQQQQQQQQVQSQQRGQHHRTICDVPFSYQTVGGYLLWRLYQAGADAVFGVPGDFAMGLFDMAMKAPMAYVGMCNELNAAYAADGYARMRGIGVVMVTYAVGELSALNGIAGAFAERLPVIIVVGMPPTHALKQQPLLHHTLGNYQIPFQIFDSITCSKALLDDPMRAPSEIDRVIKDCLFHKKPGYIGVPSDLVMAACQAPQGQLIPRPLPESDRGALREAAAEAVDMINHARRPIIIVDVMTMRSNAQQEALHLIESTRFPFVTMMMGKSIIDERHPQFVGLYNGSHSRESVRLRVEHSDCVILLGVLWTDFNTGGFSVQVDKASMICVNADYVSIRNHHYQQVNMSDFVLAIASKITPRTYSADDVYMTPAHLSCVHRPGLYSNDVFQNKQRRLTTKRFFDLVATILPEGCVVMADIGQALFALAETLLPAKSTFICQAFYGAIGYSVGATVGLCASLINMPPRHVFLFVGDGSLQISCQDLSTLIRYGFHVTVFVLNNNGYSIERCILDGAFNDIANWKYHLLPLVFNAPSTGADVYTEGELEHAVSDLSSTGGFRLIEVHLDRMDVSEPMKDSGHSMAQYNSLYL